MDRARERQLQHEGTMRVGQHHAVGFVLQTFGRDGRESDADAAPGRTVHDDTVLWSGAHDGMASARGFNVNAKRVRRLMRQMGLEAIYQKPRLSQPCNGHQIYPYQLRGVTVSRADQVWSSDITYIRLRQGFIYLVAIMDWFSRYVLAWEVSVTMESSFCISALDWALQRAQPEIFNSDQGAQFTSAEFTDRLSERGILISMDGRGRALDNVFVERLWRTVKYEEVYLKDYRNVGEAIDCLTSYFHFYNHRRIHQALDYRTPEAVYRGAV